MAVDLADAKREQEEELYALQSIYEDEITMQPQVWGCACFDLVLTPFTGDDSRNHVSATVRITYTKAYPFEAPRVDVVKSTGLADNRIKELKELLVTSASENLGVQMVVQLASDVQDYLVQHNHKPMSAYEAMQSRAAEETKREAERKAEQHKRAVEEEAKRAAALHMRIESELRRRRSGKQRRLPTIQSPPRTALTRKATEMPPLLSLDSSADGDEPNWALSRSRYRMDFEEIGELGRGGFGQVLKVRNRMDGMFYAVKIIKLEANNAELNHKIRREVLTVSRLYHRHIVRYYQAWVEGGEGHSDDDSDSDDVADDWQTMPTSHSQRGLLSSKPGTPVRRQLSVETATTASSGQGCATGAGIGAGAGTAGAEDDSSGWEWEMSVGGGGDGHDDDLLDAFPQYGLNIDTLDGADDYATVGNRPRTVTNDTGDTGFTTETDDNDQEAGAVVPATPKRAATKYLYIQMEYCEGQTLREAIDEGALAAPPDVWRLFRQIVEALSYIHGRGVIHRDIKPPNIFLDSEGNIKLGDFGLATAMPEDPAVPPPGSPVTTLDMMNDTSTSAAAPAASPPEHPPANASGAPGVLQTQESVTSGVGTTLYRAPEQEHDTRYDEKADMYSLGIIFFEMWHPKFDTYMERASTIASLRANPELVLAADSPARKNMPGSAVQITLWLLRTNAQQRPSAEQLLASQHMPRRSEMDEVYMEEAVRAITKPHSALHERLLERLFQQPTREEVDFTFDAPAAIAPSTVGGAGGLRIQLLRPMRELLHRDFVVDRISHVFRRHGAVNVDTPLLMPRPAPQSSVSAQLQQRFMAGGDLSVPGGSPSLSRSLSFLAKATDAATPSTLARLLDVNGTVVQLPLDLREPFARFVARQQIRHMKRFCVGPVYRGGIARDSTPTGGQPKHVQEADFDVVWTVPSTAAAVASGSGKPPRTPGMDEAGGTDRRWSPQVAVLEAEVLTVAAEVMHSFSNQLSGFYLRINHSRLCDGILDMCGIPNAKRDEVCRVLSRCVKTPFDQSREGDARSKAAFWASVRTKLIDKVGLSQKEADGLKVFTALPPDMSDALAKVQEEVARQRTLLNRLKSSSRQRIPPAEHQLRQLQHRGVREAARGVTELQHLVRTLEDVSGAAEPAAGDGGGSGDGTGAGSGAAAGSGGGASGGSGNTDGDAAGGAAEAGSGDDDADQEAEGKGKSSKKPRGKLPRTGSAISSLSPFMRLDVGYIQTKSYSLYNNGLRFQVLLAPKKRKGKRKSKKDKSVALRSSVKERDSVGEGGRYDDLIAKFRLPADKTPLPVAVGVRFTVDKLSEVTLVAGKRRKQFLGFAPPTDVLVCSTGAGLDTLLPHRLTVARMLWSCRQAVEYLHPWPASYEQLERLCQDRGIHVMVIVKDSLQRGNATLRVRTMDNHHDDDVRLSGLCARVVELVGQASKHKGRGAELRSEGAVLARAMMKLGLEPQSSAGGTPKTADPVSAAALVAAPETKFHVTLVDQTARSKTRTRLTNQAIARLSKALLPAATIIPVVVTELPYMVCRDIGTLFMKSPTDVATCIAGVDDVDMSGKHRKTARDTLSTLVSVFTSKDHLVPDSPNLVALSPTLSAASSPSPTAASAGAKSKDTGASGASVASASSHGRRGARRRRAARRPGFIVLYSSSDDRFDILALK